jgi:hypothetical protein
MMPGSVVEAIIRKEFMTMKSKLVKIEFGIGVYRRWGFIVIFRVFKVFFAFIFFGLEIKGKF